VYPKSQCVLNTTQISVTAGAFFPGSKLDGGSGTGIGDWGTFCDMAGKTSISIPMEKTQPTTTKAPLPLRRSKAGKYLPLVMNQPMADLNFRVYINIILVNVYDWKNECAYF
jgi:hypothetical protein